jgi:hypothetical protein
LSFFIEEFTNTQKFAKRNRSDKKSIGNIIDTAMQGMNYGQTNGIPQGSVLMDFIAEMESSRYLII